MFRVVKSKKESMDENNSLAQIVGHLKPHELAHAISEMPILHKIECAVFEREEMPGDLAKLLTYAVNKQDDGKVCIMLSDIVELLQTTESVVVNRVHTLVALGFLVKHETRRTPDTNKIYILCDVVMPKDFCATVYDVVMTYRDFG